MRQLVLLLVLLGLGASVDTRHLCLSVAPYTTRKFVRLPDKPAVRFNYLRGDVGVVGGLYASRRFSLLFRRETDGGTVVSEWSAMGNSQMRLPAMITW